MQGIPCNKQRWAMDVARDNPCCEDFQASFCGWIGEIIRKKKEFFEVLLAWDAQEVTKIVD